MLCSGLGRLNTVKKSVVPKLTYIAIPVKFQVEYFRYRQSDFFKVYENSREL